MPPRPSRRTTEPSYEVERERIQVEAANVTPLRESVAAPMAHAGLAQTGADDLDLDLDFAQPVQQVANGGTRASDLASSGLGDFKSPFDDDDELETPAFLRKGGGFSSLLRRGGD